MPTLELFIPPTHRDGWRQVRAPGGQESWNFAATHLDGRTRVVAGLHVGHPHDTAYVRQCRRFLRRPTHVLPPAPNDYPSISLDVWEGERMALSMLHPERGVEVSMASDRGQVRIGGSHFETAVDGSFHLGLRGVTGGGAVTADLVFRPAPGEAFSEQVNGPERLIVIAADCEVEGEVSLFDANGSPRVVQIAGRGFHSHSFATRWVPTIWTGVEAWQARGKGDR